MRFLSRKGNSDRRVHLTSAGATFWGSALLAEPRFIPKLLAWGPGGKDDETMRFLPRKGKLGPRVHLTSAGATFGDQHLAEPEFYPQGCSPGVVSPGGKDDETMRFLPRKGNSDRACILLQQVQLFWGSALKLTPNFIPKVVSPLGHEDGLRRRGVFCPGDDGGRGVALLDGDDARRRHRLAPCLPRPQQERLRHTAAGRAPAAAAPGARSAAR
ncbi:Protein of unknown function, partial [Gryllus bimaculatus]